MFAFGLDNPGNVVDVRMIIEFYKYRDSILSVFEQVPKLSEDVYLRGQDWQHHPLLLCMFSCGLVSYIEQALETFPAWKSHEACRIWSAFSGSGDVWRQAGALIDVAVLLIRILDVYEPSRSLIQNIYHTNIMKGVLGGVNLTAVETALRRHLGRVLGSTFINPPMYYFGRRDSADLYTSTLIKMIECDISSAPVSRNYRQGLQFEQQCLSALRDVGFEAQTTSATGDFGADILAMKDDLTFAIQCKDAAKPSGVKAVQEAVGARSHYGVDFGAVCSTGGFTDAALLLASSNRIVLSQLAQLVSRLDAAH